ncbi:hypothetical protein P0082_08755 [Candidatus Haliotispira prima]|uniref:Uncharacterized protein n=1 Tax=Candidatus Haliotispira prima TaxID=3034016 RepID=A0ABY8MF66_9SPIO|nr:hypothetical protein P0082_08755 [Candidatus Haliotispira prima]
MKKLVIIRWKEKEVAKEIPEDLLKTLAKIDLNIDNDNKKVLFEINGETSCRRNYSKGNV